MTQDGMASMQGGQETVRAEQMFAHWQSVENDGRRCGNVAMWCRWNEVGCTRTAQRFDVPHLLELHLEVGVWAQCGQQMMNQAAEVKR